MKKTGWMKEPLALLLLTAAAAAILLFLTGLLTYPALRSADYRMANTEWCEVLPSARSFVRISADLPEGSRVTEVYRAANNTGYVFAITCDGFGGKDTMHLLCGIGGDGRITGVKTLSHAETEGLGSRTTDRTYWEQYLGADSQLRDVDSITGATVSSISYLMGIASAFEAYEIVKGD